MLKVWVFTSGTVILALLSFLFSLFFADYLIHILTTNGIISLLFIILYVKFYRRDTQLPSSFFLIDRVRSIRFAAFYHLTMTLMITGIILSSPVLLYIVSVVVLFLLISVANLVILVISIFQPFNYIAFSDALWEVDISFLDQIDPQLALYFALYSIGFIVGSIGGYILANYVEDLKTGIIILSMNYLLAMNVLVQSYPLILSIDHPIYSGVQQFNFLDWQPTYQAKALTIFIPTILSYIYSIVFFLLIYDRKIKADYDLPVVRKIVSLLLRILELFILFVFVNILLLSQISSLIHVEGIADFVYILPMVVTGGIGLFYLIKLFFYGSRGDYPVEQRLFEIEYREELLEEAKKFQEED